MRGHSARPKSTENTLNNYQQLAKLNHGNWDVVDVQCKLVTPANRQHMMFLYANECNSTIATLPRTCYRSSQSSVPHPGTCKSAMEALQHMEHAVADNPRERIYQCVWGEITLGTRRRQARWPICGSCSAASRGSSSPRSPLSGSPAKQQYT